MFSGDCINQLPGGKHGKFNQACCKVKNGIQLQNFLKSRWKKSREKANRKWKAGRGNNLKPLKLNSMICPGFKFLEMVNF